MWRLAVVTAVLWNTITSQTITDDPENDTLRHPRQLDFVHCCPCPSPDLPNLSSTSFNAAKVGANFKVNSVHRAASVDDCPCARGSDAQEASSVFFPRAVPFRPLVNQPETTKEDQKPLLHPEVDLASSMLETLREVTDEEYQDALARDAARNAARVSELGDVEPETAKNLVTIIVNPRGVTDDDTEVIPEASNVQETSCIHPLEMPTLGQAKDASNAFKLQSNLLHRNAFDMDGGASELKENTVSFSKGLEGLKLKTIPSVLKLFPPRKANEGNIQSLLKLKNDNLPKPAENGSKGLKSNLGSKIPNLKLTPLLNKNDHLPLKPVTFDFKRLRLPTLRTNLSKKPKISDAGNIDSNTSPSNLQEQLSKPRQGGHVPAFDLKTLIPTPDPAHFSLKNLLKLKDVELIQPKSNAPKTKIPGLNILLPLKDDKSVNSEKPRKPCKHKEKEVERDIGVERSQNFQTEILDTLPHASENHPVFVINDNDIETTTVALNGAPVVTENSNFKTQILNKLPSASENTHIVANSEHEISLPTPPPTKILETTNADRELEQNAVEEPVVKLDRPFSNDDNVNANPDDSSLELIIGGDEDTEINSVEFIEETDQPVNNINNIGGVTFNNDGQSFNVDFIEDTLNINNDDSVSVNVEHSPEFGFQEEQEEGPVEDDASGGEILFRGNVFTDQDNLDVVTESTNQDTHLIPEEDIEQSRTFFSDGDFKSAELQDEMAAIPKPNPKTDLISSFKEKISLKLETLRNPEKSKILTISRLSIPENKEKFQNSLFDRKEAADFNALTEEVAHLSINEKSAKVETAASNQVTNLSTTSNVANSEPLTKEAKSIDGKTAEMETGASSQVTIQDLSNMSNSLLAASQSQLQKFRESDDEGKSSVDNFELNNRDGIGLKNVSTEMNVQEGSSYTDTAGTTLRAQGMYDTFADDNLTNNHETEADNPKEAEQGNLNTNTYSCPSNFETKQDSTGKSEMTATYARSDENEIAPQASETIFKTALQPLGLALPLQQSIVVQPNALFNPSSLLPPLSPLNLGGLNLPTLEDLTSGLQGLLDGNARASNGDGITSSEFVSAEDCSEADFGMATSASTNKDKSALAPLKHLEDINLDIFQMNPLSDGALSSKLPSLNLNTFKTKLPWPPSLDLKPLKLESTLGRKNGGLLGAALTFGPEKLGSSRKSVSKLDSILNKQGSYILGNPLGSMPSLEELRSTMRANTQSLFKSPLTKQTLNPLQDTLRSSLALGDSFRSHTENTMRNLQQSLASTLAEPRTSGAKNAGGKFAKPQELFEMVSLAHEDMNDKLHAIHVDLQDRLSSIHDRIIDQSNLPALKSPLLGLAEVEEEPKGTWRVGNQKYKPSTRAQSSRLTTRPKTVVTKKPTAKVNKPKPKDVNDVKPFKMSKAASSLSPKSIEVPKLVASSSTPPFFRPLQRADSLKLREPGSTLVNERPIASLKKPFKPFGDFKITIAVTPKPITTKTASRPESLRSSVPKEQSRALPHTLPRPVKQKPFMDSRGFASEPKPSQPAPLPPVTSKFNTVKTTAFRSSSLPSLKPFLKSRASNSKPFASPEKTPSKTGPTKISLPKPTESPLVAKMRDAFRIRLSRPAQPQKLQHMGSLVQPMRSNDMTNAASHNNAVVLRPEPMKENVSYKCKMICVRD